MKKVCVCYTGKNRFDENTIDVFNKITDGYNKYTVVFLTWENEDTNSFEEYFKDSKIFKTKEPTETSILEFSNGRSIVSMRGIANYYKQLYIRYKVIEALDILKEDFDVILILRTDTKIWKNISMYYNYVNNDDNNIFTAVGPNWDIWGSDLLYGNSACPDVLFFSNHSNMKKILSQINFPEETLNKSNGHNHFHPESSFVFYLNYLKMNIIRLPFDAYIREKDGHYGLPPGYNIIKY